MSAKLRRRPRSRGATPGPNHSIGTSSRVWSVPGQVGSQPWSAVISARSPGRSARVAIPAGARRRLRARPHSRARRGGGRRACRSRRNWRRRARRRGAPSASASVASNSAMLSLAATAREMPRWAKMSAILPIDTTVPPAAVDAVEQRVGVRRRGEVLAVGGAAEVVGALADERPRDHAADIERLDQFLGDARRRVEPLAARNASRARRSGTRSRPRCSRSACRCGCAPRRARR